jgi:hypothetical protein
VLGVAGQYAAASGAILAGEAAAARAWGRMAARSAAMAELSELLGFQTLFLPHSNGEADIEEARPALLAEMLGVGAALLGFCPPPLPALAGSLPIAGSPAESGFAHGLSAGDSLADTSSRGWRAAVRLAAWLDAERKIALEITEDISKETKGKVCVSPLQTLVARAAECAWLAVTAMNALTMCFVCHTFNLV